MATHALLTDFLTDSEREAIPDRYFTLLDAALASGNTSEVANLLTLSAYWNSNPFLRPHLTEAANNTKSINGHLSVPEKRVNAIAAEIYTQIDRITGKCDKLDSIPA